MLTHGLRYTSEYRIWTNLKTRCLNPSYPAYANHGALGIQLCKRWREFENFYADMGPRPSSRHSIKRHNNDGPYDPANCFWGTYKDHKIRPAKASKWGPTFFQSLRFDYIDWRLAVHGSVRRQHIIDKFDVSVSSASRDLKEFERLYPGAMWYDITDKQYVVPKRGYKARRRMNDPTIRRALALLAEVGHPMGWR
jgi:hypothetical protein